MALFPFKINFQRKYIVQVIMETGCNNQNYPQLWCSGGSTPTANPPDLQDVVTCNCTGVTSFNDE